MGRPKLLPIEGGPCSRKGCACIFASYHTPARQKKEAIEDEVLVPRHGALVIKVPRTGDRGGGKPKGEPGHACSWLPVHFSARVALCIKPQPPVLLEGVHGVWRCRWIEGGLKGSLSLGWWKARTHTAVLLGLCFQVQGMHPSLLLMLTAHASLCPGSEDLADVQPYHLNPVYNVGSRFRFSDGLFTEQS